MKRLINHLHRHWLNLRLSNTEYSIAIMQSMDEKNVRAISELKRARDRLAIALLNLNSAID